jgi:hypothetical protein
LLFRSSLFVLFFVFSFRGFGFYFVAPRIPLWPRHDAGDIRIESRLVGRVFGAPLLRFLAPGSFLLLFFRSRALALALPPSELSSRGDLYGYPRLPAGLAASSATAAAVAAVAAEAAAAAATAAAEAAGTARFFRTRFVHRQRAAAQLRFVQLGDRLLRAVIGRHLDEPEAARAAGGHVAHDGDRFHRSNALEQFL